MTDTLHLFHLWNVYYSYSFNCTVPFFSSDMTSWCRIKSTWTKLVFTMSNTIIDKYISIQWILVGRCSGRTLGLESNQCHGMLLSAKILPAIAPVHQGVRPEGHLAMFCGQICKWLIDVQVIWEVIIESRTIKFTTLWQTTHFHYCNEPKNQTCN